MGNIAQANDFSNREMKLEELMKTPMIGESELAQYWRVDEQTIYAKSKPSDRTIETISANVALVKSLNDHVPVKLIITIAKSKVPPKAVRELAEKEVPLTYSAMAMIAPSRLTGFIINLIYGLKKPPIPMKTFATFEEAEKWIKEI